MTVRDSRNRQHDPILGVVPLRLSELLEKRSQVTRWYPLDGGIGFGRIRISLLFRSMETKLPPNMLGWDVGTFEFTSPRILALNYNHHAALKLRTGGSVGRIGKHHSHRLDEGDGYYWDVSKDETKKSIRLPVKYRYRSPVIFEFHTPNHRKPDGYAIIWLQTLIDNEDTPINLPIWKTKNPNRLTQNYITEENFSAKGSPGLEDVQEIGRLQFRGRFKAGMDESHGQFVVDNNTRETFETWEACLSEGVRERIVHKNTPDSIQEMHEKSLTEGRDILKASSAAEKKRWTTRTGEDWSGAFGHDPTAYMDNKGRKRREPGRDPPLHDPINPSDDEAHEDDNESLDSDQPGSDDDIGIVQDGGNMSRPSTSGRQVNGDASRNTGASMDSDVGRNSIATQDTTMSGSPQSKKDVNKANKRAEERKQRGLMQWKPARNAKFAKDEGMIGLRKLKGKITGGLEGRKPDVETEA